MGIRSLYIQIWIYIAIQMQSLIFKSVAKCGLYDLQEFVFFFFLCLLMYLRNTCLHLYPDPPGFTPWGPLGPQHSHRHTCLSDPARSRQTADSPSPLLPLLPLKLPKPSPPSWPPSTMSDAQAGCNADCTRFWITDMLLCVEVNWFSA